MNRTRTSGIICHPEQLIATAMASAVRRACRLTRVDAVTTVDDVLVALRTPAALVVAADLGAADLGELMEAMRHRGSDAAIVTAYARLTVERVVVDLERGASGVLDLGASLSEATAGLHTVLEQGVCIPSAIQTQVVHALARRHVARAAARRRMQIMTPRERQVLELLVDGSGRSEIARRLGCSVHTARTHVDRVKAKLGATSQLEAAAIGRTMLQSAQLPGAGLPPGLSAVQQLTG